MLHGECWVRGYAQDARGFCAPFAGGRDMTGSRPVVGLVVDQHLGPRDGLPLARIRAKHLSRRISTENWPRMAGPAGSATPPPRCPNLPFPSPPASFSSRLPRHARRRARPPLRGRPRPLPITATRSTPARSPTSSAGASPSSNGAALAATSRRIPRMASSLARPHRGPGRTRILRTSRRTRTPEWASGRTSRS